MGTLNICVHSQSSDNDTKLSGCGPKDGHDGPSQGGQFLYTGDTAASPTVHCFSMDYWGSAGIVRAVADHRSPSVPVFVAPHPDQRLVRQKEKHLTRHSILHVGNRRLFPNAWLPNIPGYH